MANEEGLFTIWLQATDSTNKSAFARLEVAVLDENDNQPVWIAPIDGYSMHLDMATAQEGEPIAMVLAVDADIDDRLEYSLLSDDKTNEPSKCDWQVVGHLHANELTQNSRDVIYTIASSNLDNLPFSLHKSSGQLTVSGALDYEQKSRFHFVAQIAETEQRLHSFAVVTVSVVDVSDNPPVFLTIYPHGLSIREDTPAGTTVAVFLAKADKHSSQSRTVYSMQQLQPPTTDPVFTLDGEYGWLMVGAGGLDSELHSNYTIAITASDEAGLKTTEQLIIQLVDLNDSPPMFGLSEYVVEINLEAVRLNSSILALDITDPDKNPSPPQTLQLFIVHGDAGEKGGVHLLTVVASDGLHSSQAKVKVIIKSPTAGQQLEAKEDQGNRLNYLMDAAKLPFEIHNNTLLTLGEGFHHQMNYTLRIRSRIESDQGKWQSSCLQTLHIAIQNANRNAPTFEKKNFTTTIKENLNVSATHGYFVLKLDAEDEDLGEFGRLTYTISSKEAANKIFEHFSLDEVSGVLTLKKSLDREQQQVYEIPVKVADGGGLSDTAIITIRVEDVNDNAPIFRQPVYRLKVLENEQIGYVLLKVQAEDTDADTQVTYELAEDVPDSISQLVHLAADGTLKLAQTLDFEKLKKPSFQKTLYEASVKENSPVGTQIIQVVAIDSDSEHFGKVSYTLSQDSNGHSEYFSITDDGRLLLTKAVDYELIKVLHVNVAASDGGSPPLVDETLVKINVEDENDNAPVFGVCNLTAVVQEGVLPGQSLLTVSLTDSDSSPNGLPFRLELSGEGATSFAFDPLLNLITTQQIAYRQQNEYSLKVTAFDAGGMSSSCPLKVFVKQQSRYPPEVTPLLVTLNTLMGEFLGGPIGKVWAVDKDEADMLRYGIVDSNGAVSNPTSKFSIDAATGELSALPDLLPGLHRFNVSVTDGKYIVYGAVNVDVSNIDEDALDHSVSVRLKQLGVHRFVQHHMTRFHELLAKAVGVPTTSVRILSIQNIETGKEAKKLKQHILKDSKNRRLRHSSATNSSNEAHSDLDVLFTVLRGESRGYHRPTFVKQRIESSINEISEETGLEILSLTSEVCRRDSCVQKGECRDRLWLDNVHMEVVNTPSATLVCPRHVRTFECICRQGYSGRYCDVPVNQCSKELCMKTEMCIPSEELESGFVCVCPPGFGGERCAVPTCDEPSTCSQKQELSVLGNGFFQLFISNSMESRLELGVHFKTVSHNGVLMHGHGLIDFHTLQIREGCVEYRWNCGSGEAIVRLAHVRVDDGLWHHLKVSRRGRQTRIVVDESHKAEASSPPGSDVLNLFRQASLLTFGAKVSSPYEDNRLSLTNNSSIPTLEWLYSPSRQHQQHREMASELELRVEQGIIGCFGRISVDGFDLSKTEQGLRLHNVAIGCDTSSMGPCLNVPCKNGGQCLPNKTIENTYTCKCGTRYTGPNCQIDVNACASQPCPNGIACHNLYNDFHCSCPSGFTGKTCQMRGEWDVCLTSPCGPYGICVRNTDSSSSFTCNCSQGFHGNYCSERMPNIEPDTGLLTLHSFEFYLLVAVVLLAVLLSSLAIYVCRAQHKGGRRTKVGGGSKANPSSRSGHCRQTSTTLTSKFSKNSQMYQNLNSTARLPTVEVRPMQSHRIIQRNGCNSPSIKSFQSNEACVESKKGSSNASVHRVSKRNNCRKQSETASNQNLNNQSNRQYGSAAEDLQKLNGGSNDEMLRLFGRRLPENGQHSRHTSREHFFNDSPPTCSSSSHPLGDSIQCLPTTTQETADYNSQIENACVAAALSIRHEKQRIDHMTRNVLADFGAENNSDYLTMKPIHRAKPFRNVEMDGLGESGSSAPPPPMHRRQQQQERPLSTKVYDNPNEDDDTLSNITSQALDDNVT
uniref:Uncharacterized protein n=1 Tax=Ditylenchus dipsaci TaxID=166011 RepID=A0A915DAM3_9BILA